MHPFKVALVELWKTFASTQDICRALIAPLANNKKIKLIHQKIDHFLSDVHELDLTYRHHPESPDLRIKISEALAQCAHVESNPKLLLAHIDKQKYDQFLQAQARLLQLREEHKRAFNHYYQRFQAPPPKIAPAQDNNLLKALVILRIKESEALSKELVNAKFRELSLMFHSDVQQENKPFWDNEMKELIWSRNYLLSKV